MASPITKADFANLISTALLALGNGDLEGARDRVLEAQRILPLTLAKTQGLPDVGAPPPGNCQHFVTSLRGGFQVCHSCGNRSKPAPLEMQRTATANLLTAAVMRISKNDLSDCAARLQEAARLLEDSALGKVSEPQRTNDGIPIRNLVRHGRDDQASNPGNQKHERK